MRKKIRGVKDRLLNWKYHPKVIEFGKIRNVPGNNFTERRIKSQEKRQANGYTHTIKDSDDCETPNCMQDNFVTPLVSTKNTLKAKIWKNPAWIPFQHTQPQCLL